MTKLMLSGSNFLMLDEPTNHLDINSCEALQDALKEYEGTLLIVSHDRYLINSLADKIFYLTPKGIEVFEGNYEDFLKKFEPFKSKEKSENVKQPKQSEYKNKKERDALLRKTKARITRLENEIAEQEDLISELNLGLNSQEIVCDYVKTLEMTEKINDAQIRLNSMYKEWEELSELIVG